MYKRGQVTIFIIIALLLVGSVGIYYGVKSSSNKNQSYPAEISPLALFIQDCVGKSAKEAVFIVGEGGGYFFPPYASNNEGYTYYFQDGKNFFPSRAKIEEQISEGTASLIYSCTDDFKNFKDYQISSGGINVQTKLLDDRVTIKVSWPMKITKGSKEFLLKDFGTESIDVSFGKMHDDVVDLIKQEYYSPGAVCLSCFGDAVYEDKFNVSFYDGEEGQSIFVISQYNKDYNETFRYMFAV